MSSVETFANAEGWAGRSPTRVRCPTREESRTRRDSFAPGGCYLRQVRASAAPPCYYWGRLDKEWDLEHRQVRAPAFDGQLRRRNGRPRPRRAELDDRQEPGGVARGRQDDRRARDRPLRRQASLDFTWSVFNEPDLGPMFWRADWDELQRFYDYTTDAILRAFEDRGLDSNKVQIGGLELGGIFGTHLKLNEFLAHCSPRAKAVGALPLNAAVADRRLDGQRSRRVELLAGAHGGKGSPCDFISIHSYNRSEMMAAKLIHAKEVALEIDPDYYKTLWVNSHEACPDWMPPPDEAAADSYLGNGYFTSWCADVVHRQLVRAAKDARFAFGETILTVWPPPVNFAGLNAITRVLHVDDNGDGRSDRTVTVPMPIFHALGLLSDMGNNYWVLPGRSIGGSTVGGFASRDDRGTIRVLLFAHNPTDTQSRSDAAYDITLDLNGMGGNGPFQTREYRFDRDHNTPFRQARALRDRPSSGGQVDIARLASVTRDLEGTDPSAQKRALEELPRLDPATRQGAGTALFRLAGLTKDPAIRDAAMAVIRESLGPVAYAPSEIEQIQKLTECHPTATTTTPRPPDGRLRLTVQVAANGCNFVVIEPEGAR